VAKDKRSTQSAHTLISLPIFWQVLGLSLVVLILALGINTLIVLKAPEPLPSGYSMREAGAALKTGKIRLQNGRWLKAETTTDAPAFVNQPPDHTSRQWRLESEIATTLTSELGAAPNTVWVKLTPRPYRGNWQRGGFRADGQGPGPGGPGMQRDFLMTNGPGSLPDPNQAPGQGPNQGPGQGQGADQGQAQSPDQGRDSLSSGGPRPFAGRGPGGNGMFEREFPSLRVIAGESRNFLLYPTFSAAWKQPDGSYRVINPPTNLIQPWQGRLLLGFGLTALLILPLAWLLSQRLTRPIIAFSEAAGRVGFEDSAAPVVAVGPKEVRTAAEVLNAMQARIKKQVENRTALMGAIAHDLKTPLARMRLRIEDLPNPLRDKLSQDIAHMDGLIRSAMSFTSAHKLAESLRPLDLSALAEALSEDMEAVCPMEPADITPNIMVKGDAVALKRILTNLIENACRYAGSCKLALEAHGDHVDINVLDHGPGLPPAALEAVFEPFYRLEESRNRDTGGTGLGLSVARALAEAQGGSLTLSNRPEGGLEAKLTLPRLTMK
jgi:signal transduction histidine kinase